MTLFSTPLTVLKLYQRTKMAHTLRFQMLIAVCLTAACFTVIAEAVMCYECMWVKGRTDDDCFKLPEQRRAGSTSYLVDCSEYADAHGNYTWCETAIGCLDRGFGKRPSLHRACSLGPVSNKDVDMISDSSGKGANKTENNTSNGTASSTEGSTTTISTTTTTKTHERRRRDAHANDSQSDEHEAAEGKGDSDEPNHECYNLGDGETADGALITNLSVCYCNEDNCNAHANQLVLEKQKKYADHVCDGSNRNRFAAIFTSFVAVFIIQFP